jgi:hypothetical protein
MKFLTLVICFSSFAAFAKTDVQDFNKALIQNVEKEVKQDEDRFRKTSVGRGPASVQEKEPEFYGDQKIDKTVRQTGHSKW